MNGNSEHGFIKKKKIVYWGIGSICSMCLLAYPNVDIAFFIDSNSERDNYNGKPVKHPGSITDWSELFVVITMKKSDSVKMFLKQCGLIEKVDFLDYKEYFSIANRSTKETINKIHTRRLTGKTVLFVDIFSSRNYENLLRFFKSYANVIGQDKLLLASDLEVLTEENAEQIVGFPVLDLPSPFACVDNSEAVNLTDDEKHYLINNASFRSLIHKDKYYYEEYAYYKSVITSLEPSAILIWGSWNRKVFFMKHIADSIDVKSGFMEYGYLPGTIAVNEIGFFGYGEIAQNPQKFIGIGSAIDTTQYKEIEKCIIERKLDSGKFRKLSKEINDLERIDTRRKTVFLVGSADSIMEMESGSAMWTKYVSKEVNSSYDALNQTRIICEKHGWNLIFKPHPAEKMEDKEYVSGVTFVRFAEVDDLIRRSDVVVTIGSKVSYKALIYGKPLVELGVFTMFKQGCSYEVNGDYEQKLEDAMEKGITDKQKAAFVRHVMTLLSYDHWDDLTHNDIPFGLTFEKNFLN